MSNRETKNHVAKYEEIRPVHEEFTNKVENLCKEILDTAKIEIHLVSSRTKDVKSFKGKVNRPEKLYTDPIREITDLTGIRIITYNQSTVKDILNVIEKEFEVDKGNSVFYDESSMVFGYKSSHLIVKMSAARLALPEWEKYSGFFAEIQVRTVLQHAWAAVSHKIHYKSELDVPHMQKRKLSRLSALFEIIDSEFASLQDEFENLTKEIMSKINNETPSSIPIDYISMRAFMENSQDVKKIHQFAKTVGFSDDFYSAGQYSIPDLISLAKIADINKIDDFADVIKKSLQWAEEYLTRQFVKARTKRWVVTPDFICGLLLISYHANQFNEKDLINLGFDPKIGQRILLVAKKFHDERLT